MQSFKYKSRETCRSCSGMLMPFAFLGNMPLADAFVTSTKKDETYPTRISVCKHCFLVQMIDDVDPDLLFNGEYGFFTGASPSSIAYFKDYAESVMEEYPYEGLHLEIAGNDGTLLKHFKEAGKKVLNIDPASNTVDVAVKNGVDSIAEHFDLDLAMKVKKKYGRADVVMANNVLAHVPDVHTFLQGVCSIMSEHGVFIAEVQYFPHLIFNNSFDHFYHEHRSFFSLHPLMQLFAMHNLNIIDVREADTQGGSIRVYAVNNIYMKPKQNVLDLLNFEKKMDLLDLDTYKGFQSRMAYIKEKLLQILTRLKVEGKTVYGFGASAKGNTLLNFCGIGPDLLPYVVDLTPYKIGKMTPGMHIPVVHPDSIKPPDYYLLLVWNYLPGVLERNKIYTASGGKFIVPIPTPYII